MDLSALIFVALAVAWAVYLVPKALKHHEDVARTRSVDRFSHTLRVLARREPTSRSSARLVVPGKPATTVETTVTVEPAAPLVPSTPGQLRAGREAARRAAKRRLRVVSVIVLATVVVAALATASVLAWAFLALPAGLLVAWLVACRLMVKRERAAAPSRRLPLVVEEPAEVDGPVTEEIAVVLEETVAVERPRDPGAWDLVPVTLPTYVTKEPATRRTVRTIDLDSTGVWTSGRSEIDSAIAREAEDAERAAKAARKDDETRRATGS